DKTRGGGGRLVLRELLAGSGVVPGRLVIAALEAVDRELCLDGVLARAAAVEPVRRVIFRRLADRAEGGSIGRQLDIADGDPVFAGVLEANRVVTGWDLHLDRFIYVRILGPGLESLLRARLAIHRDIERRARFGRLSDRHRERACRTIRGLEG